MFRIEIAKFMFKFNNQMLPFFFDSYFIKLDEMHIVTIPDKKVATNFINPLLVHKIDKNLRV